MGVGIPLGLEHPEPPPPPARARIAETFSLAFNLFFFLPVLQLIGEFEEGAEQGGAIVVDQIHQPRFLHQAAELDELAGAGAALLHPVTGV